MLPYLATVILLVSSLLLVAHVRLVQPAVRRRKVAPAVPAVPEPEPRVPRDLDRPYPRPKGGRRKLDKTCPVCGTGDGTSSLGGKILGWPAHASCAEWLGDWAPPSPMIMELQRALDDINDRRTLTPGDPGPIEVGPVARPVSTNTVHYTGGTVATVIHWTGGAGGSTSGDVMAWLANGLISTDEARLRLNVEMLSGFGLPGPDLGETFTRKACPDCGMEFSGTADAIDTSLYVHRKEGQCEQRRSQRAPAAPVIDEYCTCGFKFTGTAEWIKRELDAHHASGACPHSVKGRANGWPKPNFAPNKPTGPIAPDTQPQSSSSPGATGNGA
jgi:hypothetical protein